MRTQQKDDGKAIGLSATRIFYPPQQGSNVKFQGFSDGQWDANKYQAIDFLTKNEPQRALGWLKKVEKKFSAIEEYHYLVGLCFVRLNRDSDALIHLKTSLAIANQSQQRTDEKFFTIVLAERASCNARLGNISEAIDDCEKLLEINPTKSEIQNLIGSLYLQKENPEKAKYYFIKALENDPKNLDILANLGGALRQGKKTEAAFGALKLVLNKEPEHFGANLNYAMALADAGDQEKALLLFSKLTLRHPTNANVIVHRANAERHFGFFSKAIDSFEEAIKLDPTQKFNFSNLAFCYEKVGKTEAAVSCFQKAVELEPENPTTRFNFGLIKMRMGDFEEGGYYYASRFDSASTNCKLPKTDKPRWLGDFAVENKVMLLCWEQGLGDTIQFCRFIALLHDKVGRLIVQVQSSLIDLIKSMSIASSHSIKIIADTEERPQFDCFCMMMDLPMLLGINLGQIPEVHGYLSPTPELKKKWSTRVINKDHLGIGLVCSGSITHQDDALRSIPLEDLYTALPTGPRYYLIQKDIRPVDRSFLSKCDNIQDTSSELKSFSETAALISNLDMVVSVDTSVAHLAGALGKKTLVMLPHLADWRWLNERCDSPWYKSIKLYRQTSHGKWDNVLSEVKEKLLLLNLNR